MALLPCTGAALLIWAGINTQTICSRAISARPLVFIGRISYSLYLWHWPLLALAQYESDGGAKIPQRILIIVIALALSIASYYFVELPIRKIKVNSYIIFGGALASAGACWLGAATIIQAHGLIFPLNSASAELIGRMNTQAVEDGKHHLRCTTKWAEGCLLGKLDSTQKQFILWGDSHAASLAVGFDEVAEKLGQTGLLLGRGGCPPLLDFEPTDRQFHNCPDIAHKLERALLDPGVKHVILAARWAYYAPATEPIASNSPRDRRLMPGDMKGSQKMFEDRLLTTVERIRRAGKLVTIIGPVPELTGALQHTLLRSAMRSRVASVTSTLEQFKARQEIVFNTLKRLSALNGVYVVYPHKSLCSETGCVAMLGKTFLYGDDNHLTYAGVHSLQHMISEVLFIQTQGLPSAVTQIH